MDINACFGTDRKGLRTGGGDGLPQEVVEQLDHMSSAGFTHMENIFAISLQHRLNACKHRCIGTHHGVEPASLGLYWRASERCVNKQHALCRAQPRQTAR